MKGISIRPPKATGYARIVRDVKNSVLDHFIPLPLAEEWRDNGAIKPVDLGPRYPDSYVKAGHYPYSGGFNASSMHTHGA